MVTGDTRMEDMVMSTIGTGIMVMGITVARIMSMGIKSGMM
jgi:hypothetical protein